MTADPQMPYLLSTYRSDDRVVIQCENVERAEETLSRVMAWLLSFRETSAEDWRAVVTAMGERFTSGNAVKVGRAMITRHEWEAVLQKLHDALPADVAPEPKPCGHLRSELLAEKTREGEPLFQMRKCLDCSKTFRVRTSVTRTPPP